MQGAPAGGLTSGNTASGDDTPHAKPGRCAAWHTGTVLWCCQEQRKVRLPRAACENKTAERRAKVADYMLEKIQSEDRESELLMAEMKRCCWADARGHLLP